MPSSIDRHSMNCDTLAATGSDASAALLLVAAVCCLAGGWILLTARRRGSRVGSAALLLVLVVGGGFAAAASPAPPAQALPSDCVSPQPGLNSLTITQTSTMTGLAPGVPPVLITGLVVNNGTDDTFIKAIAVKISSVSKAAGSRTGRCDATDYVLLDQLMPVGKALDPGDSTTFAGAVIGFSNKSVNQDACQRATIHLHYTAVPR